DRRNRSTSSIDKNRRVSARQPTCFSLGRKEKQAKEMLFISVTWVRNPVRGRRSDKPKQEQGFVVAEC
ncbi:MAG TPA: hypothetical protein VGA63_13830, partial [Geopsychrobacteraceae bacterium]